MPWILCAIYHIHKAPTVPPCVHQCSNELSLISTALSCKAVSKWCQSVPLIQWSSNALAANNSHLMVIERWSTYIHSWYYLEWPDQIIKHTLKFGASGNNFTMINALEYVVLSQHIINLAKNCSQSF